MTLSRLYISTVLGGDKRCDKLTDLLLFCLDNYNRNKYYREKIDYCRTPIKLIKKVVGAYYKLYLDFAEKHGFIKRLRRQKNKYGQYYHDYKLNIDKIEKQLNDLEALEMPDQLIDRIEEHYKTEMPAPDDRAKAAEIIRKNLSKTTFKGKRIPSVISVCAYGKRFHHPVARMKKALRKFLRTKGKKLVNLDLHQSQMCFAHKLFKDNNTGEDFCEAIEKHDLYDYFAKELKNKHDIDVESRKERKQITFRSFWGHPLSKWSEMIYKAFPKTKQFLLEIKSQLNPNNPSKKMYSNHNWETQNMESDMMNELIIELDRNGIFCLPIHDSVMVQEDQTEKAREIFEKIASKHVYIANVTCEKYD